MRNMKSMWLVVLLVVGAGCATTNSERASSQPIGDRAPGETRVVRADFGLFNRPDSDQPMFVAARKVPLVEGQGYGWIMALETTKSTVRWKEEFTLPAVPGTWGSEELLGNRSISGDRKVSVTEREVPVENGLIFNAWSVAAGDPRGHYSMRVTVEDQPARVFEFEVE